MRKVARAEESIYCLIISYQDSSYFEYHAPFNSQRKPIVEWMSQI